MSRSSEQTIKNHVPNGVETPRAQNLLAQATWGASQRGVLLRTLNPKPTLGMLVVTLKDYAESIQKAPTSRQIDLEFEDWVVKRREDCYACSYVAVVVLKHPGHARMYPLNLRRFSV